MLGLSRVPSEEPPPLYAYDPDIGRLAVTTPAYNTAIVAVNQGAFPYGGVELARLFDGDQRVAATIGGRPPAAFGVVLHNRRTGHETATQRGRLHPDLQHPPLRLVEAPRGAVAHPRRVPTPRVRGAVPPLGSRGFHDRPGRRGPHAPPVHLRLHPDLVAHPAARVARPARRRPCCSPPPATTSPSPPSCADGQELTIGREHRGSPRRRCLAPHRRQRLRLRRRPALTRAARARPPHPSAVAGERTASRPDGSLRADPQRASAIAHRIGADRTRARPASGAQRRHRARCRSGVTTDSAGCSAPMTAPAAPLRFDETTKETPCPPASPSTASAASDAPSCAPPIERQADITVVAVNDVADPHTLAALLARDSVYGRFPGTVGTHDGFIDVDGHGIIASAVSRSSGPAVG